MKLADKLMGASAGRRAVTIEWGDADRLTTWRYGLATATGMTVPPDYLAYVGPQVRGWLATSAPVAATDRAAVVDQAAAMGVLSNAALVDFYSGLADDDQASRDQAAIGNDLRNAYAASDEGQRLSAIRSLWGSAERTPYARLILTARAVARLPVVADGNEADRLVASMLSAGLDRSAARWRDAVKAGSDGWAMIMLSDPDGRDRSLTIRSAAMVAAMRSSSACSLPGSPGLVGCRGRYRKGRGSARRTGRAEQRLDEALDQAVADEQPGMVVLLCAIGMQTGDWRGVPPQGLYRIWKRCARSAWITEARMIAAEAIARA